mmetsp:Transcript_21286/g.39608  ORF Transcript_21286/g.39608 Transcript_21286/m.39608 type:complete len:142 (-) Transcript_21286:3199-3624(-)|eukprot:CAMPEP_0184512070 /NCGR_PEP_ID=MMETSP0198_2-20121128/2685_1 /TAXON_ID=1112570 /ORGANISM="Thraustochytrium sp., Strain LLF1b" /LENGTH=141 /DNA_ID=CAMNT_0026902071 /DNA_START=55 /DNA_END=480 /DNA_ORIENTATION=+
MDAPSSSDSDEQVLFDANLVTPRNDTTVGDSAESIDPNEVERRLEHNFKLSIADSIQPLVETCDAKVEAVAKGQAVLLNRVAELEALLSTIGAKDSDLTARLSPSVGKLIETRARAKRINKSLAETQSRLAKAQDLLRTAV